MAVDVTLGRKPTRPVFWPELLVSPGSTQARVIVICLLFIYMQAHPRHIGFDHSSTAAANTTNPD